jgi:hypothetical protein
MKFWFWASWIVDELVAAIFVYFFMVGLGDGTVSSYNIVEWMGILVPLAGIVGGSLWLKKHSMVAALILLMVLAIPAILALLFFFVILITNPRWN